MPMQDEFSIHDLPKDCDTFFLRVQDESSWPKAGELDDAYLPEGERMPYRMRTEMELELQGKFSIFGPDGRKSDEAMKQATIESDKAEELDHAKAEVMCGRCQSGLSNHAVRQLHLLWEELKFQAEIEKLGDSMEVNNRLSKTLQQLQKDNQQLRKRYVEAGDEIEMRLLKGITQESESESEDEEDEYVDESLLTPRSTEAYRLGKIRKVAAKRKTNRQIRSFISDGGTFLYFCMVFSIVAFLGRGDLNELYWYGKTVENTLLTPSFQSIVSKNDIWTYLRGDFYNLTYSRQWYNGDKYSPHDFGYLMLYNRVVGSIRLRQVRGKRSRCKTLPVGIFVYPCFYYDEDAVDTKPIVYKIETKGPTIAGVTETKVTYRSIEYKSETELQTGSFSGVAESYPGGGYVVDLSPINATSAKETLDFLFERRWLDDQTRALFVDFTTYNGNINKFCTTRLSFETPPYGGVIPTLHYAGVKFFRYSARGDYFVLTFEIVLLMLMFNYVEVQAQKVRAFGLREYFEDFWTSYDLVNFAVMFVCVGLRGYWIFEIYHLELNKIRDNEFVPLFDWGQFLLFENGMQSVNSLMIYLRAFKFFQLNPQFKTFQDVWSRAGADLWAFWCLLFITLFSYTSAMYVAFSLRVDTFATFFDSFLMIISYMVGSYNMDEMRDAEPFLGTWYVLTFMLQVYFCLMNIPMIILGDAYSWAYRQKPDKKGLMPLVRETITTSIIQNVSYLKAAHDKRIAQEQREKLQEKGDIIGDLEQERLKKQVEFMIHDIGQEGFDELLEAAELTHVDVEGNIPIEDYKSFTIAMNNIKR